MARSPGGRVCARPQQSLGGDAALGRSSTLGLLPASLEDDVAVQRYVTMRSRAVGGGAFFGMDLRSVPLEQRAQYIAMHQAENIESFMSAQGKCGKCMFQLSYCICGSLANLREEVSNLGVGQRVRFAVWMHVRERLRSTNTGKLLEHVLPGSVVLTHDVPADSKRFADLLEETRSGGAFVLYPSDDALSADEFLRNLSGTSSAAGSSCTPQSPAPDAEPSSAAAWAVEAPQRPLLAVLVDGTWGQARRMHKNFEALPHVALTPRHRSEFHWRRQSREDRISTVEAGALLLEDLGEFAGGAPAVLRRALGVLNRALERQSHYDTFLNGPPPPTPTTQKRAAIARRIPKRGPGERSEWHDEP